MDKATKIGKYLADEFDGWWQELGEDESDLPAPELVAMFLRSLADRGFKAVGQHYHDHFPK